MKGQNVIAGENKSDDERCDDELLTEFSLSRNEAALSQLIERHGKLVFGVCYRVLSNSQDAEDAAQAVFLALARNARNLIHVQSLSAWLHQVAYRVALDARKIAARRKRYETAAALSRYSSEAALDPEWMEVKKWLDEELNALPEKYRDPLILHYLEGRTQEETARELGAKTGTVSMRLNRGREMLKDRLSQRGVILSAGFMASMIARNAGAVSVPVRFAASTSKAATLFSSGTAGGLITGEVALLTKGAMSMLFFAKLKSLAAIVAIGLLLPCAGFATYRAMAAELPAAAKPSAAPAQNTPAAKPQPLIRKFTFTMPLYQRLVSAEKIFIGTPKVPVEAKGAEIVSATVDVEKIIRGAPGASMTLRFSGTMEMYGPMPKNGVRAIWLVGKDFPGTLTNQFNLLNMDDAMATRVATMSDVLTRMDRKEILSEAEILKLASDPDGDLAAFGVHLMALHEPARFQDFLKERLAKGDPLQGEVVAAVVAMPPAQSVPLALEFISSGKGGIKEDDPARAPLQIAMGICRDDMPQLVEMRKALLARFARDGSQLRISNDQSADPLIVALSRISDASCAGVLQKAIETCNQIWLNGDDQTTMKGPRNNTQEARVMYWRAQSAKITKDMAIEGLWRAQGRQSLPFLRAYMQGAEGFFGQHGDETDFPRLMALATKKDYARASGAGSALIRMVERAQMKPEPWMQTVTNNIGRDPYAESSNWPGWWKKNSQAFRLPPEPVPNGR